MVRTRFAPSPTGVLHIGSIRTALFCWLYAKHTAGSFVLRIEDTDRERSTQESVDAILDGMRWLGLDYDEGPIYQTHRLDRYQQVLDDWLADGKAYHCYCTADELDDMRQEQRASGQKSRYDGRCRHRESPREGVNPVVRFRNPDEGKVIVEDAVKGRVEFDNKELDDLIIARSDGTPTYNFTVVIDDSDMQISHVIRGDDHLNNTPRQLNMLTALGASAPIYAHLPMILGEDGSRLSKRHGAEDVLSYRDAGYLPDAVLNYLVRLGWSHQDQEIFSREELIKLFELTDINRSASSFNPEKMRWVNQQYIQTRPASEIASLLADQLAQMSIATEHGPDLSDVVEAYRERATTVQEMAVQSAYCFRMPEQFDEKAAKKNLRPVILAVLREAGERLSALNDWSENAIAEIVEQTARDHNLNMGKLGQPLRVAVTGGSMSPALGVTLQLIGKAQVLNRLDQAYEFIEKRATASS